jgi:hypothetical protein
MFPSSSDTNEALNNRFVVILELLKALQALPSDMQDVKAILNHIEHDNELCYAVLKAQGWILKDQQLRLNKTGSQVKYVY